MNRHPWEQLRHHAPLFADRAGDIGVSFEFFPPKTETDGRDIVDVDPNAGAP